MTAEDGELRPVPLAGSSLPNEDDVLRLIRPQFVDGDNIDGNGFLRRPNEDDGSSINWLQWFEPPTDNQVTMVRRHARLKYGATAKLVSLNVGETVDYITTQHPNNLALQFLHDPLEAEENYTADPSHSIITGLPTNDSPEAELVRDLLVDCIKDVFPARG